MRCVPGIAKRERRPRNRPGGSLWKRPALAAASGAVVGVQALIEAGANMNEVNSRKQSALHLAVQHGHGPVVDLLVKAGANVELVDKYMNTPLSKAKAKGMDNMVMVMDAVKARKKRKSTMMQKKKSGPAPQDLFRTHSRDRMIPPGLEDTAAMKKQFVESSEDMAMMIRESQEE